MPTDYPEGFPTSVLEAVACKCFVVTTSSGGSKELISDRDYGIILNENTVEEIYRNLVNAIEDELYRINATEKAYQRLIENFTWDIVAKNLMNLIMEISMEKLKIAIVGAETFRIPDIYLRF